jgi:hypothetical protein
MTIRQKLKYWREYLITAKLWGCAECVKKIKGMIKEYRGIK